MIHTRTFFKKHLLTCTDWITNSNIITDYRFSFALYGIRHSHTFSKFVSSSVMLLFVIHLQNRILWIDEKNLTAHVEAGIVGQDLERLVSTAHPSIFIHWKSLHDCKIMPTIKLCDHSHAGCPCSVTLGTLCSEGLTLLREEFETGAGCWRGKIREWGCGPEQMASSS